LLLLQPHMRGPLVSDRDGVREEERAAADAVARASASLTAPECPLSIQAAALQLQLQQAAQQIGCMATASDAAAAAAVTAQAAHTAHASLNSIGLALEYAHYDLSGLLHAPPPVGPFLPFALVKYFMRGIFAALAECHARGVLHRDVKPSNVLISRSGDVALADFGLARALAAAPADPVHAGGYTNRVVTLMYRAPELLLSATRYGTGVDVWAAGCVLMDLVNGGCVYRGTPNLEVAMLGAVFELCGSPDAQTWPELAHSHVR
jgi:hypothetical protein